MTQTHENTSNGSTPPKAPRTPPKQLATERTNAFALKVSSFADRLRGFGADEQLRAIHAALNEIAQHVAALPDTYKPKRGAGAGRILIADHIYGIKPKYTERYEKMTGPGNAGACVFIRDMDEKTALCTFATADGEIKSPVSKNHIAKEIA